MWSELGARQAARGMLAIALALGLSVALSAPAAARAKAKKPRVADEFGLAAAFSFSPSPASPAAPTLVSSAAPLRFFTINQVLAKHDRGARGSDAVRLAALPPDTVSDAPAREPPPRGEEPFGLFAFRAPEGVLWTKWRGVERAMRAEASTIERCQAEPETCPSAAALRFNSLVETAREQTGRTRLETVSHAVNRTIRYTSDLAQHGVADLWSPPLATLANRLGDCEDYAIAKYAVLRAAGIAPEDLRIVLLRDTASREDHAVLAAREDGRWFILDNRKAGFYADSALPHYMPLFALNHRGVQVFASPYAMRPLHESETIAPATEDSIDTAGGSIGDAPFLM